MIDTIYVQNSYKILDWTCIQKNGIPCTIAANTTVHNLVRLKHTTIHRNDKSAKWKWNMLFMLKCNKIQKTNGWWQTNRWAMNVTLSAFLNTDRTCNETTFYRQIYHNSMCYVCSCFGNWEWNIHVDFGLFWTPNIYYCAHTHNIISLTCNVS